MLKTFKEKNNKLMPLRIDDDKHKTIMAKIKDLKKVELNALPVHDARYIKTKIRTCDGKVHTHRCCLNVPKDDIECESFKIIPFDSLLDYENKYYIQVHLVLIKL